MTTFDRHIIARMLAATTLLVGLLVVFFIVLDYLEHVDDFMDRGATLEQVIRDYYINYIPEIIRLTSPLAVFIAAIYVTGRLAQTLQIVALRSAGVSLSRIVRPYALVGALVTVVMFGFNGWVVPRTQASVLDFQNRYLKNAPETVQATQLFRQNAPGSVLSVGYYDHEGQRAYQVSLLDFVPEDGTSAEEDVRLEPVGASAEGRQPARRLARRLDASEMQWIDSLEVWRMRSITIRSFDAGAVPRPAQERVQIDTVLAVQPRDLARTERDTDRLTIPEAAEYIASLRRAGADRLGRPLVSYYSKFSYPMANLLLVLIAVPLASVLRRGGQTTRLALGLFVAFTYLSFQKLTEPFGYTGALPPLLVAWLPHVVFLGVALLAMASARK